MPDADPTDPASPEKAREPELHGLDPAELLARGLHDTAALQTEVLVFIEGQETLRCVIAPGRHILGRDAACNLPIDAPGVAERHACLIVSDDGALLLEDLGSADGTFL